MHEAVYSATKFGLRAFTFALAEELEGSNVKVSAVSPGPVDTGFIMDDIDDIPDVVFAQPMSSAADIAKLILDCAADGTLERVMPQVTGYLATAGYLLPALRKIMLPHDGEARQAGEGDLPRAAGRAPVAAFSIAARGGVLAAGAPTGCHAPRRSLRVISTRA